MTLPTDFVHELNLLIQYDASNSQTGLKVHHDAAPEAVAAAQRLFEKGLVSQHDGGYLTKLGKDVAEHLQVVRNILE
ncbi:MAG TPA: TIGR02647 family protein [Denitromonas sp.]|uniref:TIGR02647 family protein n=1 Tax=Denitromonas sp. TaxID=2734609 RepID=UPI001DAB48EB|nr:TIGR02647 family protein [Rhodocyclaceae bacterium]MCP5222964.1 TIGR02647 family protein [Zoogloeaceae bacterium]HPR07479.1 TIGR02647 family protein [Denitromonas sp.]HQU89235.1 TIGR02647 family protein [Denitromonas sp.]HQV15253.1 TIGR02647 family protein [Denitromonas sp.]